MVPKVRLLTVLAVILTASVLLLTAGAQQSKADSPVEIEFWHAMSRSRGKVLTKLVDQFNKENPGIVVNAKFVGATDSRLSNDYNALYRTILENLARNTPPDVSQVYENWTTQLIGIGALSPIDDHFTPQDKKSVNDLVPIFKHANTFADSTGAHLYTMPFNKSIYVLYYNKDIFSELGLSAPKTWQELRSAAIAISKKKNIPGIAFLPSVDIFGHYLYAHGGEYIGKESSIAFGGPLGVQDLQYWVDLVHKDRAAVPTFDSADMFQNGQCGMYIETTSRIGGFEKAKNLNFGVVNIPKGTTAAYQFAGTNLAIYSHASPEKQAAACKFILYMSNQKNTIKWATATGYLPVRTSAIQSKEYRTYVQEHPEYSVGINALAHATVQPRVPAWESIRGILDDAMFKAIGLKYTSAQALQEAVDSSSQMLVSTVSSK